MLVIDSVTLSFLGNKVLSNCYIHCASGEVVGLLGRNGSGKSSLLKVIFGSLQADYKHLRIDDVIIQKAFLAGKVAYLPQQPFWPRHLKVKDLFNELPAVIRDELFAIDTLQISAGQSIGNLSHGEQRILECLWILHRPAKYILLDEPFSAIAPIYIEFLQKVIRERSKEKGIILTDHLYRPLLQVADRVVLLHNNSNYKIQEPADLIRFNYLPE